MRWLMQISDNRGNTIAELDDAHDRQFIFAVNRVPTGTFRLRRDHSQLSYLRNNVDKAMVKLYGDVDGDRQLRFNGPVVGYSKVADESGGSVVFNCAGIGWRLGLRILDYTKSGAGFQTNSADRAAVMMLNIGLLPGSAPPAGVAQAKMDTGIRGGSLESTASAPIGPWYYKNALEALSELAATIGSYEWSITPTEPTPDAQGVMFGRLNLVRALGASKPQIAYEYGDGNHNVKTFTETADASKILNRAYTTPPQFPSSATQKAQEADSAASINDRGTVYEDLIANNLVNDQMRLLLIQNHIAIRDTPKMVISFDTVRTDDRGIVPAYGADVNEGDVVTFRAVEEGVETINTLMRIYGFTINIDDEGNTQYTPTLLADQG